MDMEMDKVVERINFLYKKSTEEEKDEQQKLRRHYIDAVKRNFRAQLNMVEKKKN